MCSAILTMVLSFECSTIAGSVGLFDKNETSENFSKLGNPLEKLYIVIDFEMFRFIFEENMLNQDRKNNAGNNWLFLPNCLSLQVNIRKITKITQTFYIISK
jgi:hypothetical protein